MLSLAAEQGGLFMDRAINLAEATILTSFPTPSKVCDFPEPECPPVVACTLIREVFPGERVVEPILVRNQGKETREFVFNAEAMESADGTVAGPVLVSPDRLNLSPNQTRQAVLTYDVTTQFVPGRRYTSEIEVNGYCKQIIRLVAHVASLDAARCVVSQKEYPKECRHDWRDHFYCDCAPAKPKEPARQTDDVTPPTEV